MKSKTKKLVIAGATVSLGVAGLLGASDVHAKGFSVLGTAGQVRSTLLGNAVIDGQYAADASSSSKSGEGKCGEGKCGENKKGEKCEKDCPHDKEHKAGGEGKCGEGKCGEGKKGK